LILSEDCLEKSGESFPWTFL